MENNTQVKSYHKLAICLLAELTVTTGFDRLAERVSRLATSRASLARANHSSFFQAGSERNFVGYSSKGYCEYDVLRAWKGLDVILLGSHPYR